MSQQNLAQTRVIDPILSQHARGYRRQANVGRFLFPLAPVNAYGGQVLQFGKEGFRLYNSKRAPGTNTKRIQFGYNGDPYAIVPRSLEGLVPFERMRDASQVPGIDLASRSVNLVLGAMQLEEEFDQAKIARDATRYDNDHKLTYTGATSWNTPDSDPSVDINTGKEAVADSIGIAANTLILSSKAASSLKFHPKLIERIKFTSRDSITVEMLKALWEVENIYVGGAKFASGPNDAFADVWGTDAVLAYVAQGDGDGMGNMEEPSYGYTYQIEGMPLVEQPYQERSAKSWIYPVTNDSTPVATGMAAGYLLQGAGLPAT